MFKLDTFLLILCAVLLIGIGNVGVLLIEYFTVGSGIHPAFGFGLIAVMLGGIYVAVKMIQKYNNNNNH